MNLLDIFIVALVVGAAVHGARVGAAIQVVTFAGFLAGIVAGAALTLAIDPHVAGQLAKTLVALVLLLVPATLLASVGRQVGGRAWRVLRRLRAGAFDAALGALVAIAGTLVICWLFAAILVNSAYPSVSREISGSRIVRAVADVLPPVPDAFALSAAGGCGISGARGEFSR